MENEVMFNEGTQSLSMEPAMGGELMPVNNPEFNGQPSGLEMAASVAVTMAVGYGIGKLGEVLFEKVIGPAAKKVGNKFDEKMAKKKAKKSKKEEDILEGNFKKIDDENEDVDPDENQDEQTLPKKGMRNKSIDAMRKKRKH